MSRFGQRVRTPSVMTDPWNLLVDIQEFRGNLCRPRSGELVFSALSTFAEASRAEVIPEYAKDVVEGLVVRRAWATVTRTMGPLNTQLNQSRRNSSCRCSSRWSASSSTTRDRSAINFMRAGDKRLILQFAQDLSQTLTDKRAGRNAQLLVEGPSSSTRSRSSTVARSS